MPGAPPSAKGAVPLTASGDGIALEANTTYWLVLDVSGGTSDATLFHTSSDAEDAGKLQDWSIANTSRNRAFGDTTWTGTPDDDSLQLVVHATPNPTTVLVGNYGQPDDGDAALDEDHAQAFRTGPNGNRLTQVDLEMLLSSGAEPDYTVKVHSDLGGGPGGAVGVPGGELGTLTREDSLTAAAAKVRFTADGDGLVLTANTTYWIVVDVSTTNAMASLGMTSGKGEDAGRATGWSIANKRLSRVSTATTWDSQTDSRTANVLKIAVHGDTTLPEFSWAAVNGPTLTVSFSEDLDETSVPAPGDFHVTVGGSRRNVVPGGVSISGRIVSLTLESAVSPTGTDPVQVRYTQPDAGPLRDIAGNPVATFADQDVTRNLLVGNLAQPPTTNPLGYGSYDAAQSFTTGETTRYTLTGVQLAVGVAVPGNTTEPTYSVSIHADSSGAPGESLGELTNPAALANGVNTFTAPDGINLLTGTTYWVVVDVSAAGNRQVGHRLTGSAREHTGVTPAWSIADTIGFRPAIGGTLTWNNSPASLKMAVLGRVTDSRPPAFRSAKVEGNRLKVHFDEDLDPDSAPDGSAFHIFSVNPRIVGTGRASIEGKTVTVILERAVPPRVTVLLYYRIPAENPLQDAAGNDVPGFGPNPLTNNSNTTPPAFVSATFRTEASNDIPGRKNKDRNQLTVTFNEELDPAFAPPGSAFSLRDQGGSRTIAGIGTAVIDGERVTVMLAGEPDLIDGKTGLFVSWRVSYVRPSANGLRDYTGRLTGNFSNRPATYKPSGETVEDGGEDDPDGPNVLIGFRGDDTLNGTDGDDGMDGNGGNDTLNGKDGHDSMDGGPGNDTLNGGPGNDRLYGDLFGSGAVGDDIIDGGPGHDYLVGGPGADRLDGGQPDHPADAIDYDDPKLNYYDSVSEWFLPGDTASYWWSLAGVTVDLSADDAELQRAGCAAYGYDGIGRGGNAEGDCLTGIENIVGSGHRDNLTGNDGPNLLRGGDRADTLDGGGDLHRHDAVDYRDSDAGVKVDLARGRGSAGPHYNKAGDPLRTNKPGFANGDIIRNIRTVHGSNHHDVIVGDGNANTLYGHKGDDKLRGGSGADTLHGGAGTDEFHFHQGFGADTINDYSLAYGEGIHLCMGTVSNQPTWTGANSGSNYVITVTFNGATTGTITLYGITTSSPDFADLNITALASNHRSCSLR